MAEGSSSQSSTSDILCRYHMHGACRDGAKCNFSHDLKKGKPDNVCRYYLNGSCVYGQNCRYDHVRVKPNGKQRNGEASRVSPPNPPIRQPLTPQYTNSLPPQQSNFVSLKKRHESDSTLSSSIKKPEEWVNAVEFVPGRLSHGSGPSSYLAAAGAGLENTTPEGSGDVGVGVGVGGAPSRDSDLLCPYYLHGACRYADKCTYTHGDLCQICDKPVLMPNDEEQNNKHQEECLAKFEEDMKLSFAHQRSMDKTCGICMEVIMEKSVLSEQRFGILSNCNHVYCLSCIRKWRQAKQFENKIVRACPECRIKSDFVTPSKYWVEDEEDKTKLIEGYKHALSKKPCKYFDEGRGECQFNENCFYRHAYPDGRPASPKPKGRRKRQNADGELDLMTQYSLWEYLEERSLHAFAIAQFIDDEWNDIIFDLNLVHYSDDDSNDIDVL